MKLYIKKSKKAIKIKNIITTLIMLTITKISFAVDGWIFGWEKEWRKIKDWEIWFEDIPNFIVNAINILMWLAATISVLFIIIGAYKILFGSISQDKTKWRDTIIAAVWGFILASLSWTIMKFILDNFS